ncbi:MAG: YicC family protein [Candidatus Edwardsbacteria bacterium]|jgi:uncharacterized protein (TIGR00255 family)|nr:YicC family protein [Candidatus Edwardsbacteria bacterium]
MMIKSMTGYGRSEQHRDGRTLSAEVRTVNHRFAEYSVRLPGELAPLEGRVRELLQQRVPRGAVVLTVGGGGEAGTRPVIDREQVARYLAQLRDLKREHGLKGGVDLRTLVALPGVVAGGAAADDPGERWDLLAAAVAAALDRLDEMRRREGRALQRDLAGRVRRLGRLIGRIQSLARRRPAERRRRLQARVREIAGGLALDPARLAQEVALFAERADITEELVRLRSHCAAFAAYLAGKQPVGRRLDFLLQEMNREANTIGSKAGAAGIAQLVVELKEQLEKMREQAQNVE